MQKSKKKDYDHFERRRLRVANTNPLSIPIVSFVKRRVLVTPQCRFVRSAGLSVSIGRARIAFASHV